MHSSRRTQIAYLKADKALFKIPNKYVDFVDVFLSKLATKFLEYIGINNNAIELVDD